MCFYCLNYYLIYISSGLKSCFKKIDFCARGGSLWISNELLNIYDNICIFSIIKFSRHVNFIVFYWLLLNIHRFENRFSLNNHSHIIQDCTSLMSFLKNLYLKFKLWVSLIGAVIFENSKFLVIKLYAWFGPLYIFS